jgi:DNA repair exonuclease SbcCD nuclease subunit
MKIALITDTHWGARGDSNVFAEYFNEFYYNYFFPYLEQNNISRIFHLGDIVDRRKYINFVTARHLKKFVETCHNKDIWLDVIVGNHDTSFKNTNDVNSMHELFSHSEYNIRYFSDPTEVLIDDTRIAVLPWVCSGNYDESMKFLADTNAQILFGHLEIQGFEMYKGSVNDHGFTPALFDKFDVVCSGHFHHKSTKGNINYLGAPYEMSWSDYNDVRGFHIFDTDTRELTFVQNPYTMFSKLHYNDSGKTMEDVLNVDFSEYKGKYVKVITHTKSNPYWFDKFIESLEKSGAVDIQVVEDNLNLNLEEDEDIVNEAEDTVTILKKVIDQMDTNVDKKRLDNFLVSLYNEALSL